MEVSFNKPAFGILGDFPGDDDLLRELNWCCQAFQSPSTGKPPLARLVSLLGLLPLKGRHAVVRQYLASSPHRDAILRDLFDYCFQFEGEDDDVVMEEEADDEFVLIANPSTSNEGPPKPLNLNKFHIFQVVIVLIAVSGPAGAEMSRRYLSTASTKYRAKILTQCVACFSAEEFTNDELYKHYCASPASVQSKVIEACKRCGRRKDFLRRVYESDDDSLRHYALIYWLESDYLASKLDDMIKDKNKVFKLRQWGVHGDVYIAYIRCKMKECQTDQLKLGSTWQALRQRIELNSIKSSHIYALLDILQTYRAYLVLSSARKEARRYLEGLSANGDDVSGFDVIFRCTIDSELIGRLTKKERLQLAIQYVRARDWDKFCKLQYLVPRHKLPYKTIFSDANSDDLWSLLSGSEVDPFLQLFSSSDLFASAPIGPERAEVLKSWADLHLRSKPSDLSDEQVSKYCHGKSTSTVWQLWYDSYRKFYQRGYYSDHLSQAFSAIADDCKVFTNLNSRFKVYTVFVQDVLEIAVRAMEKVSTHLRADIAVTPVLALLQDISFVQLSKSSEQSAQSLAQKAVEITTKIVLPLLGRMMQFDPSLEETYITKTVLSVFESKMEEILGRSALCEEVCRSLALTVLEVCSRASQRQEESQGFAIATDSSSPKRRKFAYFDFHLHERVEATCYELAKKLLSELRRIPKFDLSLSKQLWGIVRRKNLLNLSAYLHACSTSLPSILETEEKTSIIDRSVAFVASTYRESPDRWKAELSSVAKELASLGLLETVLDNEVIPSKVRNSLLIDYGGFGSETARQSLKDGTFAADGETRAVSLSVWLAEACKTDSASLIAEAMSFAATRLKNESGVHRRTVFAWLEVHFATEVVAMSLEDNSGDSSVHVTICSAILAMQKNDLSRLDCVGRHVCFPTLPRYILDAVLGFDPNRPCLERRQLWMNCAIRLHWELQAASGGDESLQCYSWPLVRPKALESSSWISLQSLEALYPTSKFSSKNRIDQLIQRADLSDCLRKDFVREQVFGPMQCVAMLEKAIDSVWTTGLLSRPLRLEGGFPEEPDVAEALRGRLEVLFRLSGAAWQEVELLTTVFDRIFADFNRASDTHLLHASQLLKLLFEVHGRGACEIPRLAEACDKLFRHVVAAEKKEYVQQWLRCWKTVYLERGSRAWVVSVDDRLQNFLHQHAEGFEPEVWPQATTRSDRVSRECSIVRILLSMSPSALLLHDVRKILFTRRQDVLLRFIHGDNELQGVFRLSDGDYDTIDELLFHTLDDHALLSCHADISRRYAGFARTEASSTRRDLRFKIGAISKFMNAPSTQHADVLDALQSNLEDAVREALINRVFCLDSPWHILGFLLSQKAIENNDQRVTAALLGYVAQHVHVDTVVRVVGLLLKEPRRKKVSFQLHKGVIRMLFEAKTPEAMLLLRVEWENDLPDGVRSLVVEKCVQSVANGKTGGWEASVLSEVAVKQSYGPELKFCLFGPQWTNVGQWTEGAKGGIVIPKADGVSTDELLDQFRQNGPFPVPVNSGVVAEKFRSLLEELENSTDGSLQFLAKLKKLSLSTLFARMPLDDQAALNDMLQFLTSEIAHVDHKTQVGMNFVSVLFAVGICNVLKHTLPVRTMKEKDFAEYLNQSDVVCKLRACIRAQVEAALDLPVRQQKHRALLLRSLASLMETVNNNCPRRNGLPELLVAQPIDEELKMLKNDVALVTAALRTCGPKFC